MHDDDEEHAHFDFSDAEEVEDIEGIEKFTLTSVGIDIGSSTTHTIFSRLILRREGAGLSAKFVVTNRDVLYKSDIMLTPYITGTMIDTDTVKSFIENTYKEAGFVPEDIDTGAVVITGEALKKENAQPILEYFSGASGKFICASAGPMHEALLAAFGSGAVTASKLHGNTVLDVDIGGGTTKITLIKAGEIKQMAAIEVGARLIAYDDDMTVTRVEQPARTIMKDLGHTINVGDKLTPELRETFAEREADILFDVISGGELMPLTKSLLLTDGLHDVTLHDIDNIVYSGGVSEYIYKREPKQFGDLGPWLGDKVRERTVGTFHAGAFIVPTEGIRATVIGAGEYTLQASGSTSYISTPDVMPVRGIQVARAYIDKEQSPEEMRKALQTALVKYDQQKLPSTMALALCVSGQPE
jgi:ethanolamine utilization protein EutA